MAVAGRLAELEAHLEALESRVGRHDEAVRRIDALESRVEQMTGSGQDVGEITVGSNPVLLSENGLLGLAWSSP